MTSSCSTRRRWIRPLRKLNRPCSPFIWSLLLCTPARWLSNRRSPCQLFRPHTLQHRVALPSFDFTLPLWRVLLIFSGQSPSAAEAYSYDRLLPLIYASGLCVRSCYRGAWSGRQTRLGGAIRMCCCSSSCSELIDSGIDPTSLSSGVIVSSSSGALYIVV